MKIVNIVNIDTRHFILLITFELNYQFWQSRDQSTENGIAFQLPLKYKLEDGSTFTLALLLGSK